MSFETLLRTPGLPPILAALPRARLVGGCVRDTLAQLPITDIDLATPDTPKAVLTVLQEAGLRAIPTGIAHGTITAISGGHPFEITTLRRDETTDGRHAQVAWTADFEQDAARRDFTINAMSVDQAGLVHDYFGGQTDLAAGRVRFVGDASQRVSEDYLRILRFFRFYARYGGGEPDRDALAAIEAGRAGLAVLSAERIWMELKRILAAPAPGDAVALMEKLAVLKSILPEGTDLHRFSRLLACGAPADPFLRLAALFTGDPDHLADRLKFATAERERLKLLRTGPVPTEADDDAALRRLLADEPHAILLDRLWLKGGCSPELRERIVATERPVFSLEGRDALAFGFAPGPHIGEALRNVRALWMEGGCTAPEDALRRMLWDELKNADM